MQKLNLKLGLIFMKVFKHFFNFYFLIFTFHCIATEPFYLITQGYKQVSFLFQKKKISELLLDPETSKETKEKLLLLKQIKEFASSRLKLNTKNQFEYFLQVEGKAISYIVVASLKTELKPKTYWFPIVGRISYLGFFDLKDAKEYAQYLQNQNWDVKISPVDAFSTLGWFSDPILSYHLEKDEIFLVSLILHELTHNTYWRQDDHSFNESLASFVEEVGTLEYIQEYKGNDQKLIQKFLLLREEEKKIQEILDHYKKKLSENYQSKRTEEEKNLYKQKIISELKNHFINEKKEFKIINIDYYINKDYNNADFVLLNLYDNKETKIFFENIFFECKKDFDCFWKKIKNR